MLHDFIALRKHKKFPFVKGVYFGASSLYWAYRSNVPSVEFHVIEDGKLVILGAYSANSLPDGLYLDCEPDTPAGEWIYPVQNGNVLTIEQVYSATQNGNVLEVE